MESVVNGDDSLTTSSCPPRPTNLQDITFPDSPIGNKVQTPSLPSLSL